VRERVKMVLVRAVMCENKSLLTVEKDVFNVLDYVV